MHVEMADEAVWIGESAASQSYLVMDKILDAVKQTGAEGIVSLILFLFISKLKFMRDIEEVN